MNMKGGFMSILDNELVRKYFSCDPLDTTQCSRCFHGHGAECYGYDTARRVIAAMERPIKKGDRALFVPNCGPVVEEEYGASFAPPHRHPQWLLLPDRFQLDPVEAKIQEILNKTSLRLNDTVDALHDLVRLARGEKL